MKENNIQNVNENRSVVDKIRRFRNDFTKSYMKRHKKFDIHQFSKEFLKGSRAKIT